MQGTTNNKSTGTLRHVYVFYRLLRQRLNSESCFTNLKRTNATESQSTVTGTVQTTYWLNQANLTTREQLDNCEWLTDGKGEGDKFPVNVHNKINPSFNSKGESVAFTLSLVYDISSYKQMEWLSFVTAVLRERDRYRAFRRWSINHLRSEKGMGPSKLSKRLLGPLLADG